MALLVPNVGEIELLDRLLKGGSSVHDGNYTLHLFKNSYVPQDGSTLSNFTEADFDGYADKALAQSSWASVSLNTNDKAESSYSQQSWTCGATGNTIYGYYITGNTSGELLWAEKFGSSKALTNGDILNLIPVITLSNDTCP
jgi:hypothetical protein